MIWDTIGFIEPPMVSLIYLIKINILQQGLLVCFSEINILWAAHQLHHSSEDYNLTTSFRNSGVMMFGNWVGFPSMFILLTLIAKSTHLNELLKTKTKLLTKIAI